MCCQTVRYLPWYVLALLFLHLTDSEYLVIYCMIPELFSLNLSSLSQQLPFPILHRISYFAASASRYYFFSDVFAPAPCPVFLTASLYPFLYRFALPFLEVSPTFSTGITFYYPLFSILYFPLMLLPYCLFHLLELVEDRGFLDVLHDLISDANPTVVSQ